MADRAWACYQLAARSPFHLGERGVGIEETSLRLHADTLFSALCLTMRELGHDLDRYLGGFPRWTAGKMLPAQPPLRLSSAFPYAGAVFFFPRPQLPLTLSGSEVPRLAKTLKRIRWVSQPIVRRVLAGQPVDDLLLHADGAVRDELLLQGGRVWVTPGELVQLSGFRDPRSGAIRMWHVHAVPRVTVDRITSRSEVFSAGRVRFAAGCGLFCLVDFEDEAERPAFEAALRALGDAGVGGERSIGHGQYELGPPGTMSWPDFVAAEGYVTLSPYWPAQDEVQSGVLKDGRYRILNRRGWVASPDGMNLRRRGVRMLVEGSLLRQRPRGALVDVKPIDDPTLPHNVPHAVWRYGLAFPVPCRLAGKEAGNGA